MSEQIEIAVVGAGPCGIAVGAAARAAGREAVLFERGAVTESLLAYPHYMTFFSTAEKLAIGGVPFTIPETNPTRRQALAYYRAVVRYHRLDVRQREEVIRVEAAADAPRGGAFRMRTRSASGDERGYAVGSLVIATGGFQHPNLLGCEGEGLPKVAHRYMEPYRYWDADVVVVGAGNSAVEASLEIWRNGGRVTLVHFGEEIDSGVKPWVVPDITNRLEKGEIAVRWRTRVTRVEPGAVVLRDEDSGTESRVPNDFVLAMTGWHSDPDLLLQLGVDIDRATGIPTHDPDTMETNIPGVFIAGVLAAGNNANKIFIENGRYHGDRIMEALEARRS